MTHVSDLVLEVLDRAHQLSLKEGLAALPPSGFDVPSDEEFRKASLAAVRRGRRLARLRAARHRPPPASDAS